jgi:hypothetical protein
MSDAPFTRIVSAAEVAAEPRSHHIVADEAERRALAHRLGILGVESLEAELTVSRGEGDTILVCGTVNAVVVQTDVVTLDPLRQELEEAVDLVLVPAAHRAGHRPEARSDAEVAEDVYHAGRLDLGAIAGEHLALGLDPYPRARGIAFTDHVEEAGSPSPFAELARLKDPGK